MTISSSFTRNSGKRLDCVSFISEQVKLISLETKHNSLADELWGEETGLAKVTGELSKTNLVVQQLTEEMKRVQEKKPVAISC